jgi:hypothetical protein
VEGRLVIFTTFECRRLLAFKTDEKAQLFLKEKIDLINNNNRLLNQVTPVGLLNNSYLTYII